MRPVERLKGPHDYSQDSPVDPVYNRPGFKAWEAVPLVVLKYVDDNIIIEKFCFNKLVIGSDGKKTARPTRSKNFFRQITRIAESMVMKVNTTKTGLLCGPRLALMPGERLNKKKN